MTNRALPVFYRAFGVSGAPRADARLYVYENATTTQLAVYADAALTTQLSQPVMGYSDGTFRDVFVASGAPVRVLITDGDNVPLPGFPRDNVPPESSLAVGASQIAYTPGGLITAQNVQAAISQAAGLANTQTDLVARSATIWAATNSGSAYAIAPAPALTAYGTHQSFRFTVAASNGGTSTLNVNGLGARPLRRIGRTNNPTELDAGFLQPGVIHSATFDGTQWIVASETVTNGAEFVRLANGWQFANQVVTFTRIATDTMGVSVTWPQPYISQPAAQISLPFTASNYTNLTDRTTLGRDLVTNSTTSGTVAILHRDSGGTFNSAATIQNVSISSYGRWYTL